MCAFFLTAFQWFTRTIQFFSWVLFFVFSFLFTFRFFLDNNDSIACYSKIFLWVSSLSTNTKYLSFSFLGYISSIFISRKQKNLPPFEKIKTPLIAINIIFCYKGNSNNNKRGFNKLREEKKTGYKKR